LSQAFSQLVLFLPVEGHDNTLAYGFRFRPQPREMSYYMEHAMSMGRLHEINYNEVLAAIYTTNPIGSGVI
jgi:hypothetical protein